ncbi:unnamed protein product [Pocillopora meandrina]|uniref:Uncharacterized protein n=1 Tax=Pocillopora meandrina TaxID=46732 RepID=A0AAU9XR86_9CNID|nr:unnamed protein product [Pocillopora meandrina]
MNKTGFRACVKELCEIRYDPVSVSYVVPTACCECFKDYPSYQDPVCTANGTTYDNKCWHELNYCKGLENNLMYHTGSCEDLRSSHRHNGEKTWLGLNDKSVEGNFTWADRGEGNFTAWAKNQPYNYKEEDCVQAFGVKHNYEWNDMQCSDCHQFTCKKDLNECERNIYGCRHAATCAIELGAYSCKCNHGYFGEGLKCYFKSCSAIRQQTSVSGTYVIDPDGAEGLAPFTVYCDMSDKNGVGVTAISHDTERRTRVKGTNNYVRDIHYTGASLSQLASLTKISSNCEQFIQYECHNSFMTGIGWWVSRDLHSDELLGRSITCGMTNSCADSQLLCNCDKNDNVWREDSGILTDKNNLPVRQMRFSDTTSVNEEEYHTLGKLKCYGIA